MADFQELDLDALEDAITERIKTQFPALKTVESYPDTRKRFALPAVLVELSDWDGSEDDDAGTGQLPVRARFEARIIIDGLRQRSAKREIRKLAGALSVFIKNQRWGMGASVDPANVLGAYPDEFDPELDQFEVWRVEWEQTLQLGANAWAIDPDAVVPSEVFVGIAPKTGPSHIDDYVRVYPNE